MPLSKTDRREVAKLVERVISISRFEVDAVDIEAAAEDPESQTLGEVSEIVISTEADRARVRITGMVNKHPSQLFFDFPPNDPSYLDELKRVQNHDLWKLLLLYFTESPSGSASLMKIRVWAIDPTRSESSGAGISASEGAGISPSGTS